MHLLSQVVGKLVLGDPKEKETFTFEAKVFFFEFWILNQRSDI